jgi:hypothetical protein
MSIKKSAATMYVVFGGNVADLEIWLKEERFPDVRPSVLQSTNQQFTD